MPNVSVAYKNVSTAIPTHAETTLGSLSAYQILHFYRMWYWWIITIIYVNGFRKKFSFCFDVSFMFALLLSLYWLRYKVNVQNSCKHTKTINIVIIKSLTHESQNNVKLYINTEKPTQYFLYKFRYVYGTSILLWFSTSKEFRTVCSTGPCIMDEVKPQIWEQSHCGL